MATEKNTAAGNRLGGNKAVTETAAVCLMFICGVIIRFIIANREYVIRIYYDELFYYHIAASLSNGTGIRVYNLPANFRQILYSVAIQPAFLFRSVPARLSAIAFINSLMMNSGVFAVHYISKKLIRNKPYRLLVCLAYLFTENLAFIMSLMSENLYAPLVLFLYCLFYKLISEQDNMSVNKKRLLNAAAGFVSYLAYLSKVVALSIPFAYAALLGSVFICRVIKKTDKPKALFGDALNEGLSYVVGFAVPYLIMKFTVFSGVGGYSLPLPSPSKTDWLQYVLFAFCMYICTIAISMLNVPIIFGGVYFDKLSSSARKFYAFLIYTAMVTAGVVAITINLKEDYPSLTPRVHMRYIFWLPILFIIVFIHAAERIEKEERKNALIRLSYIFLFSLIVIIFFRGGTPYFASDNGMWLLKFMTGNAALLGTVLLFLFSLAMFFLLAKKKRLAVPLFLLMFSAVQLCNGYKNTEEFDTSHRADDDVYKTVSAISEFIDAHPGDEFLTLSLFERNNQCPHFALDTFFTQTNIAFVNAKSFMQDMSLRTVILNETAFVNELGRIYIDNEYDIKDYRYVIIQDPSLELDENDSCVLMKEYSSERIKLYRIEDGSRPVMFIGCLLSEGETISFTSDNNNAAKFILSGMAECEDRYTWTSGSTVRFKPFRIAGSEEGSVYNVNVSVRMVFNAPQPLTVYCNSEVVYEAEVSERGVITFPVTVDEEGFVELEFSLPDAVSPKSLQQSDDYRKLALALESITVEGQYDYDYILGKDEVISFGEENNNTKEFIRSGLSLPDGDHTWNDGNEIVFSEFRIDGDPAGSSYDMRIAVADTFYSTQRVQVYCNSRLVYEEEIKGAQVLSVPVSSDSGGYMRLQILLPDAVAPVELGISDDSTRMALALSEISFERN